MGPSRANDGGGKVAGRSVTIPLAGSALRRDVLNPPPAVRGVALTGVRDRQIGRQVDERHVRGLAAGLDRPEQPLLQLLIFQALLIKLQTKLQNLFPLLVM
jgi:hypothetical protein